MWNPSRCLRNLVDYNAYLKHMVERGPVKVRVVHRSHPQLSLTRRYARNQPATMQTMEKFERGMGLTLKNAWLHAEAVQVQFAAQVGWMHALF